MPFHIDGIVHDRWVELMTRALDEARFPEDADTLLREFFKSLGTFLTNRAPPQT